MKNKKNIIILILLIIAVAFSSLLFFGIGSGEKTSMQISSFIFVILTEIIIFGNILFLTNKKTNTFTIAGFTSTAFIYSLVSLIFNVLLNPIFTTLKGNLIFNFSILLIYLFIDALVLLFKKEA